MGEYRIIKTVSLEGEEWYHAEYRGWFPVWSGLLYWGVTNGNHPTLRKTISDCHEIIATHRANKKRPPKPVVIWQERN